MMELLRSVVSVRTPRYDVEQERDLHSHVDDLGYTRHTASEPGRKISRVTSTRPRRARIPRLDNSDEDFPFRTLSGNTKQLLSRTQQPIPSIRTPSSSYRPALPVMTSSLLLRGPEESLSSLITATLFTSALTTTLIDKSHESLSIERGFCLWTNPGQTCYCNYSGGRADRMDTKCQVCGHPMTSHQVVIEVKALHRLTWSNPTSDYMSDKQFVETSNLRNPRCWTYTVAKLPILSRIAASSEGFCL